MSAAELFRCPNCNSQYKLIRVEADPAATYGQIECPHCGGPLNGRGGAVCPEILSGRPAAAATQANARQIGRCAASACRFISLECGVARP